MTPSRSNPNPTTQALADILHYVSEVRVWTAHLHGAQQDADEWYDSRTPDGHAQDRARIDTCQRELRHAQDRYLAAVDLIAKKNGNTFGDVIALRDQTTYRP